MMMFVKVYFDSTRMIDALTDAEAGRYLKAVLHYAQGDEVVDLPGKEQLAFLSMQAQIDRDRVSYEKKSASNRANGRLGGRPSQAARENPNNPDGSDETQLNPIKAKITQDKRKTRQEEEEEAPLPPTGESGGNGFLSEDEMETLADGLNEVLNVAEQIGLPMNERTRSSVNLLVADYGAEEVVKALDIANQRGKPTLGYLMGVLKKQRDEQSYPKPTSGVRTWRVTDDDC